MKSSVKYHPKMPGNAAPVLRLIHYWWPLAMGYSLTMVVRRATGWQTDTAGLTALLTGIVAAYSLDRVIDVPAGKNARWLDWTLRAVSVGAGAICIGALVRLPSDRILLGLALAALSLSYPRLKRLPLAKTLLVAAVWTWATIGLAFDTNSFLAWRIVTVPVAWPMFLLVSAGCLLCDLKDTHADRAAQISSLPVMVGMEATAAIACVLALGGAAAALLEGRPAMVVGALCLAAASLRPPLLASDATGPLLVDAILTLPGVLIATRMV